MFQITNDEALNNQVIKYKGNQDTSAGANSVNNCDTGNEIGRSIKNLSTITNLAKSKKSKLTKPKKSDLSNAKADSRTDFLIPKARKALIHLQKAFTKALILRHFDPERHIWIETDTLGYAIGKIFSQLTLDQLSSNHVTYENHFSKSKIGQWHPVAFFSQKMILAKTQYKTHNQELLAIVEAFKTWRHYLKGWKYKVLVFLDHNNLHWFIDTKT